MAVPLQCGGAGLADAPSMSATITSRKLLASLPQDPGHLLQEAIDDPHSWDRILAQLLTSTESFILSTSAS